MSQSKKYIFIGGSHRSGTTLLAKLLSSHPSISDLSETGAPMDEGQFLQDVYRDDNYYGGPGFITNLSECHLTEEDAVPVEELRKRILELWEPYWDASSNVYLEKSPMNILKSRFLQALFPNSYFIFIVRHPLIVSMAQQKWTRTSHKQIIDTWIHIHSQLKTDLAHLNNFRLITYEHFCSSPQRSLDSLFDWLGLERKAELVPMLSNSNVEYDKAYNKMYDVVYNPLIMHVRGGEPYPLWKRKLINFIERKLLDSLTNSNLMLVWKRRDIERSMEASSDSILQWGYDVSIPDKPVSSLAGAFSVDQQHVIE